MDSKFKRLLILEKSDTSLSTLSGGDAHANVVSGSFKQSGGGKRFDKRRNWKNKDKSNEKLPPPQKTPPQDLVCPECKQKQPPCRSCGNQHKCTTQCNSCKGRGHIKICCPTAVGTTAAAASVSADLVDEENVSFSYQICVDNAPLDVSFLPEDNESNESEAALVRIVDSDCPSNVEDESETMMSLSANSVMMDPVINANSEMMDPVIINEMDTTDTAFSLATKLFSHMEFIESEFR